MSYKIQFMTMLYLSISLALVPVLFAQQPLQSIIIEGVQRDYIIEVPEDYTPVSPMSLVLMYHGMTSNAQQAWWYSFHRFGAENNFITVYPQGLDDIENVFAPGTTTTGWKFESSNNRDVLFTKTLIDTLSSQYSLIPNSVYVTGMSNGGFITNIIGCNLGDQIAAIAPEVGGIVAPFFSPCPVTQPLPVMTIGSAFDAIVDIKFLRDATQFWKTHNNTDSTPITENFCSVYSGSSPRAEVQYCEFECLVNGVPAIEKDNECHTWPSAFTGYSYETTEMIIGFFKKHDLGSPASHTPLENGNSTQSNEPDYFDTISSDAITPIKRTSSIHRYNNYRVISTTSQTFPMTESQGHYTIYSVYGSLLWHDQIDGDYIILPDHLTKGTYVIKIEP